MEKLNEGKPILKGERLSKRMSELNRMISTEHAEAQAAWQSTLEHARNAGEWLIEAKWRTGHRTKWGRWKEKLAREYNISPRTMSQYMQIARHWDDPRITEARNKGFGVKSIAAFMRVMRGDAPTPPTVGKVEAEPTPANVKLELMRQSIRDDFAKYLRTLDNFETEVLVATLDDVLEVLNTDLRDRVCGNYEGPYYGDREEASNPNVAHATRTGPPSRRPNRHRRHVAYAAQRPHREPGSKAGPGR